jgi:hypothetical protein
MVKRGFIGAVGASEKEQHDNRATARKVRYCGRNMTILFLLTRFNARLSGPSTIEFHRQ